MLNNLIISIKSIQAKLASPNLVALALLWLIVLLIFGTLEQKFIGLYAAQQKYFSSFVLWQWGFALPATRSVLLVICVGIVAKISQWAAWKLHKLGNSLVHVGVLFLLAGTLFNTLNKQEGYLVLQKEDASPSQKSPIREYMEDYYAAELVIMSGEDNIYSHVFKQEELIPGSTLTTPQLAFNIVIDEFFTNVNIERVTATDEQSNPNDYTGFAKIFKLSDKKSELNGEENLSGAYFTVIDKQTRKPIGKYAIFENMPIIQSITHADLVYQIIMQPQRTPLPFGVGLIDFSVDYHPASEVASGYKSEVLVYDKKFTSGQRAVIEMNEPLRYKDWTLYQSAFNQAEQGSKETSILVAVKSSGRLIPYIAGLIISFGLLLHIFVRLPRLLRITSKP
ncbi:MAG: cytochrome c biogenesis protein ResB [Candidatus Portiera sp.]|nr:cytochrome c biogenesis protein ResB [Portiera sp.]